MKRPTIRKRTPKKDKKNGTGNTREEEAEKRRKEAEKKEKKAREKKAKEERERREEKQAKLAAELEQEERERWEEKQAKLAAELAEEERKRQEREDEEQRKELETVKIVKEPKKVTPVERPPPSAVNAPIYPPDIKEKTPKEETNEGNIDIVPFQPLPQTTEEDVEDEVATAINVKTEDEDTSSKSSLTSTLLLFFVGAAICVAIAKGFAVGYSRDPSKRFQPKTSGKSIFVVPGEERDVEMEDSASSIFRFSDVDCDTEIQYSMSSENCLYV